MNAGVILIVNAGSSSLKFSLFRATDANELTPVVRGQMEGMGTRPRLTARDAAGQTLVEREFSVSEAREARDAIRLAGAWLRDHFHDEDVIAVGHRVVHGGAHYARPVLIDETVYAELESLIPLAPLHQPHNLAAIRAVREWQRQTPQVACFDTAFHRTHRNSPTFMRCRGSTTRPVCDVTVSMVCRMNTLPPRCLALPPMSRMGG